MNKEILTKLIRIVGKSNAITNKIDMTKYLTEWRGVYKGKAGVILKPKNSNEVSKILKVAHDTNTPVITFEADGLINFEDGDQDVSYATRASQTWVKHDGPWRVMYSHWSPRTNPQGVPQQE